MQPIAHIHSPYRQKFAVPRQPNLVRKAIGDVVFAPGFTDANLLRGIEGFSHVWLLFVFDQSAAEGWSATVTPPRLGGSERVGVFASRSPHRPNPLGMSVVEVAEIIQRNGSLILRVRGPDLVDGTPILDIKPYLPYADCIPDARSGYAPSAPATDPDLRLQVRFSETARGQLADIDFTLCDLAGFITDVLQQDPRPAHHSRTQPDREYGMHLYNFNVRWRVDDEGAEVLSVDAVDDGALPWKV